MTEIITIIIALLGGLGLGWLARTKAGHHTQEQKTNAPEPPRPKAPEFDDEDHRENEISAADTDADPRADDAVDSVVDDILSGRRYDP